LLGRELKLGFIGAGTVGTAFASLLHSQNYKIVGVSSRTQAAAANLASLAGGCPVFHTNQEVADAADLIFITTPDDAIAKVVSQLKWHRGQSVVHCSGAASTDILAPAQQSGTQTGSIHPLQTLAGIKEAIENIPGSTFAIEGEKPLLQTLKDMATSLGGNWIVLKADDKVLYHAAAVIACNYLVTLVKIATDLWQTFAIPPDQATRALLPLLRGTLHNIETIGIPNCLTGPIARGDTGTISNHLSALTQKTPDLLDFYRSLGLQTIPIALAKGKINEQQARELETVLIK
jgi:predicted short-subunit dehydrogenase-like oxidoreductase (DUF2520 family)